MWFDLASYLGILENIHRLDYGRLCEAKHMSRYLFKRVGIGVFLKDRVELVKCMSHLIKRSMEWLLELILFVKCITFKEISDFISTC